MGKRRKAIRWLAAIVIVALIGGVTAVAVDRRIREQVEEEYLNRVMEMVNLYANSGDSVICVGICD